jgi:CPA2 family monovalent cation:H+ antiporter-2
LFIMIALANDIALISHDFLGDLALVLCVAAITTVVFQALRQPVVVGYLVAGMIVGPHLPIPIFVSHDRIEQLSELGVILLMFAIGLEFRLRSLIRLLPTAGFITVVQVGLLIWLGYVVGQAFGWSVIESLFAGAMIAISSTTIIAKAFAEEQVDKRLRELVFGVALFEDLVAVILLAILTAIATGAGLSARTVEITVGKLALFLVATIAAGFLIVPRAIRLIARFKRKETLVVASVGICFAFAMIDEMAGYSVALGAFLAGVLVAESGHAHEIEELVAPLRDIFGAVFFVSAGMMLDPRVLLTLWPALLALIAVVLIGKLIGVTTGAILSGSDTRTAVRAGLSMAQIGEFSFIIASVGLARGATHDYLYSLAIGVAAITTFLTPFMIRASDRVGRFVEAHQPRPLLLTQSLYAAWMERARTRPWRRQAGVGAALIFVSSAIVVGIAAIYEFTWARLDLLVGTDIGLNKLPAAIVVRALAVAMSILPGIGIWRGARRISQAVAPEFATISNSADGVSATYVLSEVLEFAIIFATVLFLLAAIAPFVQPSETLAMLLAAVAIIATMIWRSARAIQHHLEEVSRMMTAMHLPKMPDGLQGVMPGVTVEEKPDAVAPPASARVQSRSPLTPVQLPANATVIGKRLADLNLPPGAAVVALSRDGVVIIPEESEVLRADDTLALVGGRDALEAARALCQAQAEPAQPSA